MINSNKIKGRMKELEITQADIAKILELSPPTVSQKLKNMRSLSLEEAEKLSKVLSVKDSL